MRKASLRLIGILFILAIYAINGYAELNIKNSSKLFGTVKSAQGEALTGVNIIISGNNFFKGTVSDIDGKYEITTIPSGEYILKATFIGFKPIEIPITIDGNQDYKTNLNLNTDNFKLEDIQVNGKSILTKISEAPFEVAAVSTAKIQNSTTDVKAILNKVSGVRIQEEGGLGSNSTFSLNGFSGDQVKFFLDGIPIDNYGSSFSLGDIPVNMIERIEVYKGVVPVWLGTDALGGAVNIITNKKSKLLDFSYSYGSFNTHRASVNGTFTNEETGFMLKANAFYNYSDNNYKVNAPITNSNGNIVNYQDVERFHDRYKSGTVKIEAGVTNKSYADKLLFGIMGSANDKQVQTGVTMRTVYGGIVTNSQSFTPSIKYSKKDLFTEGLDISFSAAYNSSESQVIDTLKGITYNWLGERFVSTTSNGQVSEDGENYRTFTTLNDDDISSQLNLGYQINKTSSVSLNYAYNYFHRKAFDKEHPDEISNLFPNALNKHILGFAYQLNLNKKWNTTVFGKMYHLNTKASRVEDFALETQRTIEYRTNTNNWGYGIASAYFILPELQVKASYEHTYRLPKPEELFGDGLFIQANSDLGPEQSDNYNIGANYKYTFNSNHHIKIGGSYIYRNANDLIHTVAVFANPQTHFDNLSKTKAWGIEGNAEYNWKEIFHLSTNITYQKITDQAKRVYNESYTGTGWQRNFHYGFRVPNMPYLFGNINAGFSFNNVLLSASKLDFNYHLNYVDEYFLTWAEMGSNNEDYVIPQQTSHDIELSYSLKNGKYNISAECRNLLDAKLYDKFYLQKPGRAFYIKLRYNL
ncbi:TonB-dependent receptor [Plebeiibacterium sediminum]|uniref:TonB-dependent receptor plug domain-containing protein n=1 Tax=Plebeiibacterium sediminum TaxID=2992112 RepID=A0AAE3SH59_9BACT|nr:TonB-dependent receptor [Plebeiobacterium sediminum]MCW3789016.1 TonB-dependent receptor plug domain-containing protein [Plebeiobacterium sediminum]